MRWNCLIIIVAALAIIPRPKDISGCAVAPPPGYQVGVNSEEAIIVYDSATRIEHFIRRADFRTEVKDFGFLVPTPSKPELVEVDVQAFVTLHAATAPRHVPSGKVNRIVQKRSGGKESAAMAPKSPAPEILDRKKVAGYDAIVLRAEDTDGLKKWLEENKYDARPAVMEWLKWYVEHKWIITAFKVLLDDNAARDRWAKSVRMSFETDSPFYPYREPEDMRSKKPEAGQSPPRNLRIFFLSDARYKGTLGEAGTWPVRTVWSNVCPKETLSHLVDNFRTTPKESEPLKAKTWHLTEFEDNSSPRPGTNEVFFRRSEDQSTVERPVIYYDSYEYVYEDEPQPPRKEKKSDPEESQITLWLIPGAVGVAIVLVAILFLVFRKKLTGDYSSPF
jgi:hypothetical protein